MAREFKKEEIAVDIIKRNDLIILELLNSGRLCVDINTGNVFAAKSNTPAKPLGVLTPKGYLRTSIHMSGKSVSVMLHRVVCIATQGIPKNPEAQVNHGNGINRNPLISMVGGAGIEPATSTV